jgi:hypothetical protein
MDVWRRIGIAIGLAGTLILGGAGCNSRTDTQVRGYREAPPRTMPEASPEREPARPPGSEDFRIPMRSNTPEGRELCDRMMLASDGLLADAQIIDNCNLHVVLGSKANPDDLPELMRTLVLIMHHSFPEQNVTVRAYDRTGRVLVLATVDVQDGTVTYSFP